MKRPDNPKLLVDKLLKYFAKAVTRAERNHSPEVKFKATSVLKSKKQSKISTFTSPGGTVNPYPLMTKDEKINLKVLSLAHETILEPSKTTQKLTDLGVAASGSDPESPAADKPNIPQQ